jgi:hypothetical protein
MNNNLKLSRRNFFETYGGRQHNRCGRVHVLGIRAVAEL